MYYSEVFFKKDIYNITESDIIDFFQNYIASAFRFENS